MYSKRLEFFVKAFISFEFYPRTFFFTEIHRHIDTDTDT